MPSATGSVRASGKPAEPPTVTPEAKNAKTGTASRPRRADQVFEMFGLPAPGEAGDRDCETEQDASHGRVHPGRVDEHPGRESERQQEVRRGHPAVRKRERRQRQQGQRR